MTGFYPYRHMKYLLIPYSPPKSLYFDFDTNKKPQKLDDVCFPTVGGQNT